MIRSIMNAPQFILL